MIELRILTIRKFSQQSDYDDFKALLKSECQEGWFEALEQHGQIARDDDQNNTESHTIWAYRKDSGLVTPEGEPV